MNPGTAINALSGLRVAVGVGAYAAPALTGKLFGLQPRRNPQSPYLARLFGVRDLALAGGTLASGGDARRTWLIAGLACDVADAGAAWLGHRAGYLSGGTAVMLAAPAVAAVAMGAVALSGADDAAGTSPQAA
jgi:hypothetical protein